MKKENGKKKREEEMGKKKKEDWMIRIDSVRNNQHRTGKKGMLEMIRQKILCKESGRINRNEKNANGE